MDQSDGSGFTILSDIRTEAEIFRERAEKDLVAFGSFSANDIIDHSLF